MLKKFESYKKDASVIGLVGLPSGEYLEMNMDNFNLLNQARLIDWNSKYQCMTFDDKDYDNIIWYIKDDKKIRIQRFLSVIGVTKYKINDDYSVDVTESVYIRMPLDHLPIKFDYIMGNFDISSCGLVSLQGCPETVEGDFICTNNRLGNLKYGPKEVGGSYDVRQSGLDSLQGAPERIKKNFLCGYNNMPDLMGGPRIVDGSYFCDNCLLVSLDGSPEILTGHFDCSYNLLQTLTNGPDMINGTYDCSNNDIINLDDGPASVGVFKCNGNRKMRDFKNAPHCNKIIKDEI